METTVLLRPQEAANLLGVAVTTLAKWRCTREQELAYIKRGNRVLYKEEDVRAFKAEYEQYVEFGPESAQ